MMKTGRAHYYLYQHRQTQLYFPLPAFLPLLIHSISHVNPFPLLQKRCTKDHCHYRYHFFIINNMSKHYSCFVYFHLLRVGVEITSHITQIYFTSILFSLKLQYMSSGLYCILYCTMEKKQKRLLKSKKKNDNNCKPLNTPSVTASRSFVLKEKILPLPYCTAY